MKKLLLFSTITIAAILQIGVTKANDLGSISLELNKLEKKQNDCLLTFVVSSKLTANLEKLAYEVVLFDLDNSVDLMTVFDFKDLGTGKTRVRQFQLPNKECGTLSKLLINDVSACSGNDLTAQACNKNLILSNKTKIEFIK